MRPARPESALDRLIGLLRAPFRPREAQAGEAPRPGEPDELPPTWYLT